MFKFQRSGRVKNGKILEAITWTKEITEYINAKYSEVSLQAYSEVFCDLHTIYWWADYNDLATLESIFTQLKSDEGYWAIVSKGLEWFIEGSFHDKLMSSI